MSTDLPPVLKPIKAFVQRGRELAKSNANPIVAFHCFKYGMELGIKLNDKSPECQTFLKGLITELEGMKGCTAGKSQEELRSVCENFAQNIFQVADSADRAGNSTKKTAQNFYAAANFFEILKQFSPDKELDPDIKTLVKYSKFRAAKILKATQEGRPVTPPAGEMDGDGGDEGDHEGDDHHFTAPPAPVAHVAPPRAEVPVARPAPPTPPQQFSAPTMGRPVSSLTKPKKADCLELMRFARSALEADDIPAAIERLQNALALLHE
jgi:vacuolar protein sorting-associated protein VTA1